jgi:hypothetical protein
MHFTSNPQQAWAAHQNLLSRDENRRVEVPEAALNGQGCDGATPVQALPVSPLHHLRAVVGRNEGAPAASGGRQQGAHDALAQATTLETPRLQPQSTTHVPHTFELVAGRGRAHMKGGTTQ